MQGHCRAHRDCRAGSTGSPPLNGEGRDRLATAATERERGHGRPESAQSLSQASQACTAHGTDGTAPCRLPARRSALGETGGSGSLGAAPLLPSTLPGPLLLSIHSQLSLSHTSPDHPETLILWAAGSALELHALYAYASRSSELVGRRDVFSWAGS